MELSPTDLRSHHVRSHHVRSHHVRSHHVGAALRGRPRVETNTLSVLGVEYETTPSGAATEGRPTCLERDTSLIEKPSSLGGLSFLFLASSRVGITFFSRLRNLRRRRRGARRGRPWRFRSDDPVGLGTRGSELCRGLTLRRSGHLRRRLSWSLTHSG